MKIAIRTTAAILAALLALCAVSCTETPETTDNTVTEPGTDAYMETDGGTVTAPVTDTEPETEPEPTEKTAPVSDIQTWTFDDGKQYVIGIFCKTEPDALVYVCKRDGEVLIKEHALNVFFYGMYLLPEGVSGQTVYIYAKAEGKALSDASSAVRLKYNTDGEGNLMSGYGAFIGHDSHVYLNFYDAFYYGYVQASEETMTTMRAYLEAQLGLIRQATGKNTKIICIVCTNPAVIYHDIQYTEEEGGRGDYFTETPVTQFAEFMKDSDDIYFLDLRDTLMEHRDKLLFMQADSHWTQIAAYYGYLRAAEKIKKDFPELQIYDLEKHFNTQIVKNGGDLLVFMGIQDRAAAITASVTPKKSSMKAKKTYPTAYVMGDSYYGAISPFLDLLFSEIYLNYPEINPPLYDYRLDDLETRQPDYLVYVWTERNIDADLSMLINIRR